MTKIVLTVEQFMKMNRDAIKKKEDEKTKYQEKVAERQARALKNKIRSLGGGRKRGKI